MKTAVEEQEIRKTSHTVSHGERTPQLELKVLHIEPAEQAKAAQAETASYASCLELAAQFLPRG